MTMKNCSFSRSFRASSADSSGAELVALVRHDGFQGKPHVPFVIDD